MEYIEELALTIDMLLDLDKEIEKRKLSSEHDIPALHDVQTVVESKAKEMTELLMLEIKNREQSRENE